MTGPMAVFLLMTISFTAIVAIHTAQVMSLVRERGASMKEAWIFLPGAASVMGWREGGRALPIALGVAVLLYVVLWGSASV